MGSELTVRPADAAAGYLAQPYGRLLVRDSDGTFRAEILEFPGCMATGDSEGDALASLDEVARDWLEAAIERGQSIPEPLEANEFSGRLVMRLPKSLHRRLALLAERDGVSLNHVLVTAAAFYAGEQSRSQNLVSLNSTTNNAVFIQNYALGWSGQQNFQSSTGYVLEYNPIAESNFFSGVTVVGGGVVPSLRVNHG